MGDVVRWGGGKGEGGGFGEYVMGVGVVDWLESGDRNTLIHQY